VQEFGNPMMRKNNSLIYKTYLLSYLWTWNNNLLHMLESLVSSYLELYTVEYRFINFTHFTFHL
jgi:hypothetical protein